MYMNTHIHTQMHKVFFLLCSFILQLFVNIVFITKRYMLIILHDVGGVNKRENL
jgi:hypothetical protein